MPALYTELDAAVERARERSAAKVTDNPYLTELLQLSYGVHKQTREIVFRPFYVAAKFIQQSRRDQTLKKADDAEFTGQVTPIESLLDLQLSLDADLEIRDQFRIDGGSGRSPSANAAALKTQYEGALLFLKRYQPRGFA